MTQLKKTLDHSQVIILTDSREQTPLDLRPLKQQTATLTTGDYTIKGLEQLVICERKSLQDLVMCVTKERERFEKEIQRMLAFHMPILCIEAHLVEVQQQKYRGATTPQSILGSIWSWQARGINVVWGGDHKNCGVTMAGILYSFARQHYRIAYELMETLE